MVPYLQQLGVETVALSPLPYGEDIYLSMADKGYYLSPTDGPEEIVRIALDEGVDAALSVSTPEDLALRDARAAVALRAHGIPMFVQPESFIEFCSDKWLTKQRLLEAGFVCVPGLEVTNFKSASRAVTRIGYPVVCKPKNRWGGQGFSVIRDAEELATYFESSSFSNVLLEPFREGVEFSVETLVTPRAVLAMPPVKKGCTSLDGGHALEHVRIAPYPCVGLQEICVAMTRLLGSRGPAEFEFIVTESGPELLEVNPRISGLTGLSSVASGLNTFRLLIDLALGRWRPSLHRQDPVLGLELPVLGRAELPEDWDDRARSSTSVAWAFRYAMKIGRAIGRLGLSGSRADIEGALDHLVPLGIATIPDRIELSRDLDAATAYHGTGELILQSTLENS